MPLAGHGVSFERSIGAGPRAMGGAARGLDIAALAGDADLVTTFDDFDHKFVDATALGVDVSGGFTITSAGVPVASAATQNAEADGLFTSQLVVVAGTTPDTGLNLQLNDPSCIGHPHIWLPGDGADGLFDNFDVIFACRIGLNTAQTTWDGKVFIGWAEDPDTLVLTLATGALDSPSTGALLGFHVRESGEITLVSVRDGAAIVAADEATLVTAASWNVAPVAAPTYFDLALRARYRDASAAANNGAVQGWARRVRPGRPGGWGSPRATITNRLPFNSGALHLAPTLEVDNGPVAGGGTQGHLDWWAMGATRDSAR